MQSIYPNLDLAKIESFLATECLGRAGNELWEEIDSTNNRAIELARLKEANGAIIIATSQSAGRGRSGNVWLSPANAGLYLSFIVKPKLEIANLPVITLVTGVAVVRAIQDCLGIKVGLKWVNDLIVEGKKVGGILAEYVSTQTDPYLVIGLGLNLYKETEKLPVDLEDKIGFLQSHIGDYKNDADKVSIDRNELIAFIANELENVLDAMPSELSFLLDQWRAHSITLGEEIFVQKGNEQISGQALDITNNGELILKTNTGKIVLTAGEVSIRKIDGTYV